MRPDLSGGVIKATIVAKLKAVGLSEDEVPERIEYRVKDKCSEIMFGNKGLHNLIALVYWI